MLIPSLLRFTILGFISAFSGGHCDVRNDSTKAWIVASGLTTEDFVEWANTADPLTWCPHGKTRVIVLKEGDTLWMPPGVIVVHALLTLRECLMTGGMMWDSLRMRDIANNIAFICAHDTITTEDIPANLTKLAQTAAEMEEGRVETAEIAG
ncbi:hypothetical protein LTR49_024919 [Elasticomyces elasticus]|nr:hypothetical protein LTR49_024919 [Elasticomyces elasticus]